MTLDEFFAAGGTTPAELAARIGMSDASLSRIRRGKQNITRDVILRIIDATSGKVTADGLLGLHDQADRTADPEQSPDNGAQNIGEADSHRPFSLTSFRTAPIDGAADLGPLPSSTGDSLEADAA